MNLDMEADEGVNEQQNGIISCGLSFVAGFFYPILLTGNADLKEGGTEQGIHFVSIETLKGYNHRFGMWEL